MTRTLLISSFTPHPARFGGAIRLRMLVDILASTSELTLVAYCDEPVEPATIEYLERVCEHHRLLGPSPGDQPGKWKLQLRGLLDGRTYQYWAHHSVAMQDAIDETLATTVFDQVFVVMSQMACFDLSAIDRTRTTTVLDEHNVEADLLARRAAVQTNAVRRWALALEARRFRQIEIDTCRRFDLVTVVSDVDRDALRSRAPDLVVETVPNAVDVAEFTPPGPDAGPRSPREVVFVGACHVDANRDGIRWYLDEIHPLVRASRSDVHLTIVGGGPTSDVLTAAARQGAEVAGFVDEVAPYLHRASVSVVPLRVGGGTRIKILEALSRELPVVTTTVGAEGIDAVDGVHVLMADTPEAFAAAVVRLLDDPALAGRLAAAGRELVQRRYDWRGVSDRLTGALEAAARRSGRTDR